MDVITTHINADFDSLASMLAAKKLYPSAKLVFPGSQEKNLRDFLKSSHQSFEFTRIKNIKIEDITRLIIVDTQLAGRIGKFSEIINKPNIKIHIYDHHPSNPKAIRGEVEVIKECGAAATIFINLLRKKGVSIAPSEATILALGIYEDTGSLTFTSTTSDDLKAAAYLLTCGANLNIVADYISRELTVEQVSLLNDLINSAKSYNINHVNLVITTATTEKYIGDLAVLAHKLKDMENLNVLFTIVKMENRIHLVARSRLEAVDVGEILYDLGGGGHPTAASATIKDLTIAQVKKKLLEILKNKIYPIRLAKEIMTAPVKSIQPDWTIKEAEKLETHYDINVLPVLKNNKLVGLINRQVIEKAIHHGFANSPVSDYMTTEFEVVKPKTVFNKIEELMIGQKQKFLPVIQNKKLVGAITRIDLLRTLHDNILRKPRFLDSQSQEQQQYTIKKNVNQLIKEKLPQEIQKILHLAGQVADDLNMYVYTVGGFVRDLLLNFENFDVDLVTDGNGITFANEFAKRLGGRVKSHKKFSTAVIILPDGFKIDVATARIEYYKYPAAPPTVEHSSIKKDLYRRDFSINALAIKLNSNDFGKLIDFFGGQRDIQDKVIRILHNLSFVEDPTRVLRAIRFEQRFDFTIGDHTRNLMVNAVKKNILPMISGPRLLTELVLILKERNPLKAIRRMEEFDVLKFIHPKITFSTEMFNIFNRINKVCTSFKPLFHKETEIWLIYFLGLIDKFNKDDLNEVFQTLSLSPKYKIKIGTAHHQNRVILKQLEHDKQLDYNQIYDCLSDIPLETILFVLSKTSQKKVQKYIPLYLEKLQHINIKLKGDNLKTIGIKPGPIYKKIFDGILKAKLNGLIKTKKDEINFVKDNFGKWINQESVK